METLPGSVEESGINPSAGSILIAIVIITWSSSSSSLLFCLVLLPMCLTDAVVSEQPAGSESEPAPIHNNVGLEELNKTDRLLVQQVGHHHHWHQHHRPNTQKCWDSLEFSIKKGSKFFTETIVYKLCSFVILWPAEMALSFA